MMGDGRQIRIQRHPLGPSRRHGAPQPRVFQSAAVIKDSLSCPPVRKPRMATAAWVMCGVATLWELNEMSPNKYIM